MMKHNGSPKRLKIRQKMIQKQTEKLLNKEVNRIEQKLQTLKEQLRKKKQDKQKLHNLNHKTHNFLSQGSLPVSNSKQLDQFQKILDSLKMQKYRTVLCTYGIECKQKLLNLSDCQINQMNNIPIGFRIKMKKLIQTHNLSIQQFESQKKQIQEKQQKQDKQNEQIQQILKRRKKNKKFVPMQRQIQEVEQQQEDKSNIVLQKDQTQVKIQSLHNIFNYNKQQNKVSYRQTIKQIQNNKKYCWMCLSLAQKPIQQYKRIYCSIKCLGNYEKKIKVDEKIFQINQKYQQIKQKKEVMQISEIQIIDLSIL